MGAVLGGGLEMSGVSLFLMQILLWEMVSGYAFHLILCV